jgi:hypothetical protein
MPSSFVDSFPVIVKLLVDIRPSRVVDIGPGWGKYGLACREYLPQLERLDAIEVATGRLQTQDAIYDQVITGDARCVPVQVFKNYSVALLIDVIEHMTLEDGHELLDSVRAAGCEVLVSTPKIFTAQHDVLNPYEAHLSLWSWEQLRPHGIKRDVSTIDSIIYLLGTPSLVIPSHG